MKYNPKVTVLMSVYNGEKYLREAVDSMLAQTYYDFEFVIYDDCSTDSSAEIITSYKDDRIVFRQNKANVGLTRNLADGVEKARGKYVARMDADDIAMPRRLEKQVSWMDAHEDVTILGSQVMYFNESVNSGATADPLDDKAIKAMLLVSFAMLHPTIMIRAEDLRRYGLNYNSSFRYSQDHALYFDCMLKHLKFANHPEPLLKMRSHRGSISKAKHGVQQECSCRARVKVLESIGLLGCLEDEELVAYNSMASGELPCSAHGIECLASFAGKLLTSRELAGFVDIDALRGAFTNRVWSLAYECASNPQFFGAMGAMGALSGVGLKCRWPMKLRLKFILKRMHAAVRRII